MPASTPMARKDNEVDELMTRGMLPHADDMYANWPTYVHGHDEYGHPVISEHPTLVKHGWFETSHVDQGYMRAIANSWRRSSTRSRTRDARAHRVQARRHHRFGGHNFVLRHG